MMYQDCLLYTSVLAIDDKDDNVQDIAEKVSYAVKADVRDPGILESFGVQNVDVAVIAVADVYKRQNPERIRPE